MRMLVESNRLRGRCVPGGILVLIQIHMNLAHSSKAIKETLFLRESLTKQATPPEPLTPPELLVSCLQTENQW